MLPYLSPIAGCGTGSAAIADSLFPEVGLIVAHMPQPFTVFVHDS